MWFSCVQTVLWDVKLCTESTCSMWFSCVQRVRSVVKLCTENIFSIGFSCVQRVFVFMLAVYSGRHIPKPVWDKGIKGIRREPHQELYYSPRCE
jgi:hypothetical protein